MNDSTLKQLLAEYSVKRASAFTKANEKKKEIYDKTPRLQEIDDEISSSSLSIAKEILKTNNKSLLEELNTKKKTLLKEKEAIYKSLNIDSSYFNPQFECNICKDTGYITQNYSTKMCNCLKQRIFNIEYNKINSFNIANHSFKDFSTSFYSSTTNEAKYNSSISPRENIELILKICNNFIKNFDNPNEKNLLFTGNTGLGKTFLSSCIANELLNKNKTILYQTAPIMLDSIINYRLGKSNDFNIIKNLLNVDLLIIDDLGTESLNNMKFTELFTLINARLLNQTNKITKTIISTNLSLDNIASTYGERIVSRFIGSYNICYFFGDDIRLKSILKANT